jgi:hypothetical protein
MIVLVIFSILFDRNYEKRRILLLLILFSAFGIYRLLANGIMEMYSETNVIGQMLLMAVSITYLFKLFKEAEVPSLRRHLGFWFATAILFYNAVTFFVSLFEELIRDSDSNLFHYSWQIQVYVTLLFNLVLTLGLWATRKQ